MNYPDRPPECGFPHPDNPALFCYFRGGDHSTHQYLNGASVPNEDYKGSRDTRETGSTLTEAANKIRASNHAGPRPADDPAERMAGSERAFGAVEPEFIEAALGVIREICRSRHRFQSDDVWEVLDARGIHTEHRKAMTGILRRACGKKYRLCRQRVQGEVDFQRPPKFGFDGRKTNVSRSQAVYESLIYESAPDPFPPGRPASEMPPPPQWPPDRPNFD